MTTLTLTADQKTELEMRIETMALLFNEAMPSHRTDVYISALLRCPKLTTIDRIFRAMDMAECQMAEFPMPAHLNGMFTN